MLRPITVTTEFFLRLKELDEKAKANPISLEKLRELIDKVGNGTAEHPLKHEAIIEANKDYSLFEEEFSVTLTYERQHIGLCRRLSISVNEPGELPPRSLVNALVGSLWGMTSATNFWIEDAGNGIRAINLLFPVPN